jgi:twitching motility protein PilT
MIDEIKTSISRLIAAIPATSLGQDRVNHIIEKFSIFSAEDRELFLKFFNRILTGMIEREASDIEVGGFASDGYIWMRIYGKKERVKDLPKVTMDEAAILIINLLNDNQRRYLTVTRREKGSTKDLELPYILILIMFV